jgi:L-asparagine permease
MARTPTVDEQPSVSATSDFSHEQEGYRHGLRARQVQMIAIGGAIGTGLFMGAGGRLAAAGPALVLVYGVCGAFAYLILRALGELVMYRRSSGSFISYAREFFGEKAAFVAGWVYFLQWAVGGIADLTAAAMYTRFWSAFTSVPQWALALVALVVVLSLNLLSVRIFGEMEFWFALVKVAALVFFLLVGAAFLAFRFPLHPGAQTVTPGLNLWSDNGGLFPAGVIASVLVVQGVVFAYAGIEMVGTAAGETENAERVIPRAINSVILRIAVFYVGSVLILSLLLPHTVYKTGESPFVTFFASIGNGSFGHIAGSIMNFVVLTAALSSLNAGLYSTGRILRSMASSGAAPQFTYRLNRQGVPSGGIFLTAGVGLLGIFLNLIVPEDAFNTVLNVAAICVLCSWTFVILCQMRLRSWAVRGLATRPSFRMPGSPVTSWITLAFLATILVLIAMDYPTGTFTVGVFACLVAPGLAIGWFAVRGRIRATASAHSSGLPEKAESPDRS